VEADGSISPADAKVLYLVHGDLHRPKFGRGPTFRVRVARPGSLALHVNSVTQVGAVLVVRLDGQEVVRRALPDRDGRGDPFVNEYDEEVTVPLAPGDHTVQVDNEGADWVTVDRYTFRGLR
jgi:hypothetical protein